jgi:uncharacterized protein
MIIISDTSALANLALVDQIWILKSLYKTIIIPDVVAQELGKANNPKIQDIPSLPWIDVRSVSDLMMAEEHNLDPGESYAIALAVEQKGDELLMDERRGRQVATQLGLSIIE